MKKTPATYTLTIGPGGGLSDKSLPSVVGLAAARTAAKAAALAAPKFFVSFFGPDGIRIETYISETGKTVRAS